MSELDGQWDHEVQLYLIILIVYLALSTGKHTICNKSQYVNPNNNTVAW